MDKSELDRFMYLLTWVDLAASAKVVPGVSAAYALALAQVPVFLVRPILDPSYPLTPGLLFSDNHLSALPRHPGR